MNLPFCPEEALTAQLVSRSPMCVDNDLVLLPTEAIKLSLGDDPLESVCLLVKGFKIVVWRTYIKLEHKNLREVMSLFWDL